MQHPTSDFSICQTTPGLFLLHNSSPDLELHILYTAQHLCKNSAQYHYLDAPLPQSPTIYPPGTAPDEECPADCEGSRAA